MSFTKNEYVRSLFAKSVNDEYEEFPVETASYLKGNWTPHPAQSNLHAVPQPYRDQCPKDMLKIESKCVIKHPTKNYCQ